MDIRKPIPTIFGASIGKFTPEWLRQIEQLKKKFGDSIEEIRMPTKDLTDVPILYVKKTALKEILSYLKETEGFEYQFLSDLTATDEQEEAHESYRFELVYQLFSYTRFWRIRIKTRLQENEDVPTIVNIWEAANWLEREVFDMFGIRFMGHPDLRRILMDERFEGYPLRKDYPLRGYQIFVEPQMPEKKVLEI